MYQDLFSRSLYLFTWVKLCVNAPSAGQHERLPTFPSFPHVYMYL